MSGRLDSGPDRPPYRWNGGNGMRIEILCTGDEILTGKTINTNYSHMAQRLGEAGLEVVRLPALPAEETKPQPTRVIGLPEAAAQVRRALVIDDNFDVAESMTWMLEGLAKEIRMVHSGTAAVEAAREFKTDLILCDIGMAGMDGYETCRGLRQLPGMEKVIIAAVSGYGSEEDRRKSKEAGFDRHLVKPIGRAALDELVKSGTDRSPPPTPPPPSGPPA
jgi:CheY-like chemotaxis protein